jgi:hypothetical protein
MIDRDAALAMTLGRQRAVRARHEFRSRLRAELLTAPAAFAPARPRVAWWRQAAAAAVALALVLGGGGAAAAASLPGEPAFVLKRAFEELEIALAADDAARATVALAIAERRLADLQAASARPGGAEAAATAYADALARVTTSVERLRGGPASPARDGALERAGEAGSRAVERLERLGEMLPVPAQQGIERAIERNEELRRQTAPDKPRKSEAPGRPADAPPKGPATPPKK